ncbi:MAG TPA: T9SS type A sorting domain-containing protein, partial [Candidatus Kapabacteria bacterium]
KKVLYLNTDIPYYCEDVGSIIHTFYYYDSLKGDYLNGSIAIVDYLLENHRCPYLESSYIKLRKQSRDNQVKEWRDTVRDSIATPLDTSKPTLEEIGLGILRGPTGSVAATSNKLHLGELIATRNPFTDILELKYRLDKSAMVRLDVYDLLGKAVYSEGQGYKAEGEHVLSLQSKSWSSGSYYVRLSSPSGEVKTVKVVKE